MNRTVLGNIIRGSLLEGLDMKLLEHVPLESIKAGKFLVVEGEQYDFFSIITDMRLAAKNEDLLSSPPNFHHDLIRHIVSGTLTYSIVSLRPMLMRQKRKDAVIEPVKTIPSHFAAVAEATDEDIASVFGTESRNETEKRKFFYIGTPLDMSQPVCLDLERFAERSSAVFGRTGTGKTFITRLLLAGLIKTDTAVNLVFDMHSEYGTRGTSEAPGHSSVKGLQPLFASSGKVKIYSLDPASTRSRGAHCDREVRLGTDTIEPEDILLLQDELGLPLTAAEYTSILKGEFGENWVHHFMTLMDDPEKEKAQDFAREKNLMLNSMQALWRRLRRLRSECKFLDFTPNQDKLNVINELINDLQRGVSVVIEFGRYDNMLSYLLVANIITRHVEQAYKDATDNYLRTQNPQDKPKQLVITIEEAHKFLNPHAASQTSFGKIARELRKYYVSLLLVDQRPSGIDDEVLSQIGTKIIAALSDEKDINAVLSGVSNAGGMRNILASLDTRQQVLILGHAVPMPIVIRTRNYDADFYAAMGFAEGRARQEKVERSVKAMFPEE